MTTNSTTMLAALWGYTKCLFTPDQVCIIFFTFHPISLVSNCNYVCTLKNYTQHTYTSSHHHERELPLLAIGCFVDKQASDVGMLSIQANSSQFFSAWLFTKFSDQTSIKHLVSFSFRGHNSCFCCVNLTFFQFWGRCERALRHSNELHLIANMLKCSQWLD